MPNLPLGAVVAVDFDKWDLDEEIDLLTDAGAGRVQIYRNILAGRPAADIRDRLTAAGLTIDSFHAYIQLPMEWWDGPDFDLTARDPAARGRALEIAKAEAVFARGLGCRDIIVHPTGPGENEDDPWRPEALAEVAGHLAEIAASENVRFLVENMPPPMFGGDAKLLRRVVDDVDSPHLGLAYDAGHANIAGRPVAIVREMGARLWGVHLHDNAGSLDDHFLPGQGTVPFEDVARALAKVGFAGTFMLEIYRDTDQVRRDLTPERLAEIDRLRRIASGLSESP